MEGASTKGILSHLSFLEVQARSRGSHSQQQARVKELKAKVEALRVRRDQLKAEINAYKNIQKLRSSIDRRSADEEEEMDEDSESSQLLRLMTRHTELHDLLHAHHLIGGYDATNTSRGKGLCVSLTTAYEGVYLDTYNLEIDLKPKVRIGQHNIPPFIPLNSLAEQINLQTDMKAFLDALSQHLSAFAGRKQQLKLVKEQHKSVKVMESNVLYSILVLMLTEQKEKMAILCSLDYTDHTKCLPTRVHFECEDPQLLHSPEWKKNQILLMETPVHKALRTMKEIGTVV